MKPNTLTKCSSATELLKIDLLEGSSYLNVQDTYLNSSAGGYFCDIVCQDEANLNSVTTFKKKKSREMIIITIQKIL